MSRTILAMLFLVVPSLAFAQVMTIDPSQIPSIAEALGKLSAGIVIAVFVVYLYRRDLREKCDEIDRMKRERSEERERDLLAQKAEREYYIAQWKGQADALLHVVIDNTAAMMSVSKSSEALHRREDQMADMLARLGYDVKARSTST